MQPTAPVINWRQELARRAKSQTTTGTVSLRTLPNRMDSQQVLSSFPVGSSGSLRTTTSTQQQSLPTTTRSMLRAPGMDLRSSQRPYQLLPPRSTMEDQRPPPSAYGATTRSVTAVQQPSLFIQPIGSSIPCSTVNSVSDAAPSFMARHDHLEPAAANFHNNPATSHSSGSFSRHVVTALDDAVCAEIQGICECVKTSVLQIKVHHTAFMRSMTDSMSVSQSSFKREITEMTTKLQDAVRLLMDDGDSGEGSTSRRHCQPSLVADQSRSQKARAGRGGSSSSSEGAATRKRSRSNARRSSAKRETDATQMVQRVSNGRQEESRRTTTTVGGPRRVATSPSHPQLLLCTTSHITRMK